jgi:hypothetical protein
MALQTQNSGLSPSDAYNNIRGVAANAKAQAANALTTLAGTVDTSFIFPMLDQLRGFIASINTWKAIAGLDSYATAQGYTGSLNADCTTATNAAQGCITWVFTNFPTSGGFLQAETLNADGSRTLRTFTTAQTAGLQTALQSFVQTIS